MNQQTPLSRIGALLAITIGITILYSYIPVSLSPVRQLLSLVQFGFMVAIMTIAVRLVMSDF